MTAAIIGFIAVFVLAFAGVPLAFAMLLAGVGGYAAVRGFDPALHMLGQIVVDASANYGMSVLPMFILMGLFVHKADISGELYDAANAWLGHLRGGLAHATLAACGLFAAISGSSIATAATMTKVAMPPMRRLGYHDRLSTGAVASGGVLGVLIPPSVPLVIFGLLTETDIRQLFIATIVPGILLLLLFIGAVWVTVTLNPALGPELSFLGMPLNARGLNSWFGSAFVMLTGLGLFEVCRRQFAVEWGVIQEAIEKEIKRRETS